MAMPVPSGHTMMPKRRIDDEERVKKKVETSYL